MSLEQAKLVLSHMQVPNEDGLYVLGCFEKRVTLRSQQVRALNLICALDAAGALKGQGRIAVVGGGAAGMTAAAGAARLGYDVTLLEKKDQLLPLFRGNTTRWLHPHIYDWPDTPGTVRHDGGSLHPDEAGLPLLSWRADLAGKVADQLEAEWQNLPERPRIKVVLGVQSINLGTGKSRSLSWNVPGRQRGSFDAVILAVGFGLEKPFKDIPLVSYWDNERWHQPTRGGIERYLVSGCGDGGLIDLLRLKIEDFRHEDVVRRFLGAPKLESLKQELLRIEEEAQEREARKEDRGAYLEEQYEKLKVPEEVDKAFKLRKDTDVSLNGRGHSPLTLNASILNRFLTSRLLYHFGVVPYREGEFAAERKDSGGYEVRFQTGPMEFFHHIICRHGPVPGGAMGEGFPQVLAQCGDLQARNKLDQTRKPLWKAGFFDNTMSPDGKSTPSPDGTPEQRGGLGASTNGAIPRSPFIGIAIESLEAGFKGREQSLTALHDMLQGKGGSADSGTRTAAAFIHGGGGIGKSRLAIEYVHRYRREYSGGIFFSSMEKRSPVAVLAEFARALFMEKAPQRELEAALEFVRWLGNASLGQRLLVFDEVQADSSDELTKRFQTSVHEQGVALWPLEYGHVRLLMTTRHKRIVGAQGFPVQRLEPQPAMELLLERAKRTVISAEEREVAQELASRVLGGHPLALTLAGAYVHGARLLFSEYRERIRQKGLTDRLEEAARRIKDAIQDHEPSIVATYELSRKQLNMDDAVDALAWRVLGIASFLAPAVPIDRKLLRRLVRRESPNLEVEDIGFALTRLIDDLSLLEQSGEEENEPGDVVIHPLVADYTRWNLKAEERDRIRLSLLASMTGMFPATLGEYWKITQPGAHQDWEWLSPSREAHVVGVWSETMAMHVWHRVLLSRDLGGLHVLRGDLHGAREALEQALRVSEHLVDSDPSNQQWQRDLSVSHDKLGDVLVDQGKQEEARAAYQKALVIAERLAGSDPSNQQWQRDLSVDHNKLGDVLMAQGKQEEARAAYQKALDIRERLAGSDPSNQQWQRDLSVSHDKLGDVLMAQGKQEEARAAYQKALDITERLAGSDPSNQQWQRDLSVDHLKLGGVLVDQGKQEEARAAYQKALSIAERLAGSDPSNQLWQADLAYCCWKLAENLRKDAREEKARSLSLLSRGRDILTKLAADSRLTHAQQQWLSAIEKLLREWKE